MADRQLKDLELRVARLERLLNRVLELVQEGQKKEGAEGGLLIPTSLTGVGRGEGADFMPRAEGVGPLPGAEDAPREGAAGGPPAPSADARRPETVFVPGTERIGPRPRPSGRKGWSPPSVDWESMFSLKGPVLSRLGIALLLLSVAFFFKYSIDQGWLVPWVRIVVGLAAGLTLTVLGYRGAGRGEDLGMALAGGGIATFFITGYAAHQWYSLVPYPAAFALLVVASALGVVLSLQSGRQALAMVGLVGALATPLLLTAQTQRAGSLALYVALIVGTLVAVYLARAWRALLLMAVVLSWPVLGLAVVAGEGAGAATAWVVQGAILLCALAFWVMPVVRAILRGRNPSRWPRPDDAEGKGRAVPWSVHLDALSLLMPLVAVALTAALWELSRAELGWVFFGGALLAQGLGWWISTTEDPEGSASTQTYVAILLSTVGLGLVLTGEFLYLAFIVEAAVLFAVGAGKKSRVLLGIGGVVETLVVVLYFQRLLEGGRLLEADLTGLLDLAAVGAAAFIGTRLWGKEARRVFFAAAYVGFLVLIARELHTIRALMYLAFIAVAVATQVTAARRKLPFLAALGHAGALAVFILFYQGFDAGRTLASGDWISLVDVLALAALGYIGTLLPTRDVRLAYLFLAYLGLLGWTARELDPVPQGQAWTSLALGLEGAAVLVVGFLREQVLLQRTGLATLLLVVAKVLVVDLAAVEPVWRVLLLGVFGGLFLVLSKVTKEWREKAQRTPGDDARGNAPR